MKCLLARSVLYSATHWLRFSAAGLMFLMASYSYGLRSHFAHQRSGDMAGCLRICCGFSCVSLYCCFGITHQFPRRNPGVDFLVAYTAPASSPPFGSSSGDNHRSHSAHQRSRDMAGCPRFVCILVCPPVVFVLAHSSAKHSRWNPGAGLLVAFTAPQAPLVPRVYRQYDLFC